MNIRVLSLTKKRSMITTGAAVVVAVVSAASSTASTEEREERAMLRNRKLWFWDSIDHSIDNFPTCAVGSNAPVAVELCDDRVTVDNNDDDPVPVQVQGVGHSRFLCEQEKLFSPLPSAGYTLTMNGPGCFPEDATERWIIETVSCSVIGDSARPRYLAVKDTGTASRGITLPMIQDPEPEASGSQFAYGTLTQVNFVLTSPDKLEFRLILNAAASAFVLGCFFNGHKEYA